MQNLQGQFHTTSEFDREYFRNGTRYPKSENLTIECDSSRVPRKKSGELWSTNYRVMDVSLEPPKLNFSGDYISALMGCGPSNFNRHYRLTKACQRTPLTGTGVLPKKFKGEHVKFSLKLRVCAPITLGLVGVTSRNFSTRRAARQGCSSGHYFQGRPAP